MIKRTTTALAGAIAAAVMSMSLAAHAAPDAAPGTATPPPMMDHGPGGPHGFRPGPPPGGPDGRHGPHGPDPLAHILAELHQQLKLSPAQEQAWEQARATTRQNFMAMGENHKGSREQLKTAMQQPILDLSAMHAAQEKQMQRDQQLRADTAQQWLTVYNGLSDAQKTLVSNDIRQHWQMMARHRMHHDGRPPMGGPRGEHGPHDGPPPGGNPPPPPPPPPGDAPAAK